MLALLGCDGTLSSDDADPGANVDGTAECALYRELGDGSFSFPARGRRSAQEAVAFWQVGGERTAEGETSARALGWTADGRISVVGWLSTVEQGLEEDETAGHALPADAYALPGWTFSRMLLSESDDRALDISAGESLQLWAELVEALPMSCVREAALRATGASSDPTAASDVSMRREPLDVEHGTDAATCRAEREIASAELAVAIVRTVRLLACAAQEVLLSRAGAGALGTTCDYDGHGAIGDDASSALAEVSRELDSFPEAGSPGPEPELPTDPVERQRELQRRRLAKAERETRDRARARMEQARMRLVRILRALARAARVVEYLVEFGRVWRPAIEAQASLECCQGESVPGMSPCTCVERFGAARPRRERVGDSVVCTGCPDGWAWSEDEQACVREYQPPEGACPATPTGDVDYDSLRELTRNAAASFDDPRVQAVEVTLDRGAGCAIGGMARVPMYVPCSATESGEPYFISAVGGSTAPRDFRIPGQPLPGLRVQVDAHLGYRPNDMLTRGEITPGREDGFSTLWSAGFQGSPGARFEDMRMRACTYLASERLPRVYGGWAGAERGAPGALIAYPNETESGPVRRVTDAALLDRLRRARPDVPRSMDPSESEWCVSWLDMIDMDGLFGGCVRVPDPPGSMFAVVYPDDVRERLDDRTRRCVGAVGSDDCTPPQALPIPAACGPAHRGPAPTDPTTGLPSCVADPHYRAREAGRERHGVTPASMTYADCCRDHPDGFMCQARVGETLHCTTSFNTAIGDLSRVGAVWPRDFSTEVAPSETTVRAGGGLSAYGRQLEAPYGFFVGDADAALCASGRTARAEDGVSALCAASAGERPPGVVLPPATPSGPPDATPIPMECERVSEWNQELWDWVVHPHQNYTSQNRGLPTAWRSVSDYFAEQVVPDRHSELWAIRDFRGEFRAVAALTKRFAEDRVPWPGLELGVLAGDGPALAAEMLDCVVTSLSSRGHLPLSVHPADAAESWWSEQAERVSGELARVRAIRPQSDPSSWEFYETCRAHGDTPRVVFRGVSADPSQLLARDGFRARGTATNVMDHMFNDHMDEEDEPTEDEVSGWISTSLSPQLAVTFAVRTARRRGRAPHLYRLNLDPRRHVCVSPNGEPESTGAGAWVDAGAFVRHSFDAFDLPDDIKEVLIREQELPVWNHIPYASIECGWRGEYPVGEDDWEALQWSLVLGDPAACGSGPYAPPF